MSHTNEEQERNIQNTNSLILYAPPDIFVTFYSRLLMVYFWTIYIKSQRQEQLIINKYQKEEESILN